MPANVKRAGSFLILSTYVTSLAIAVTIFGGGLFKELYDGNKEIVQIQKTSDNIQAQMGELFQFHYTTQLHVKAHDVIIDRCEDDINECQHHIMKFHTDEH